MIPWFADAQLQRLIASLYRYSLTPCLSIDIRYIGKNHILKNDIGLFANAPVGHGRKVDLEFPLRIRPDTAMCDLQPFRRRPGPAIITEKRKPRHPYYPIFHRGPIDDIPRKSLGKALHPDRIAHPVAPF